MTVGKIIGYMTELRGQEYDTETLTAWLSELEGQLIDESRRPSGLRKTMS